MRAALRTTVALVITTALFAGSSPRARAAAADRGFRWPDAAARAPKPRLRGVGANVAVQPFDGPNTDALRGLVVRIVRGRGFRPMTSLPRYEGTGQYPVLAKDHSLAAFVTADMEVRGKWQRITFLVWSGASGSIVGRWTASAPSPALARVIEKGFWPHLGAALFRARAPGGGPTIAPAAPMRIDASNPTDHERVAARD